MTDPNTPPVEDSSDLTDEDIAISIATNGMDGIIRDVRRILLLSCPQCVGGRFAVQSQAIRRRKPNVYWRIHFKCNQCNEIATKVYKAEFLPVE